MNKDPFAQFNLPPARPEFGTEKHKIIRRNAVSTSREAGNSVNTSRLEEMVYEYIKSFGANGCIGEQVAELYVQDGNINPYGNTIPPRIRGLLDKGLIIDTGERRYASSGRKARVMVADIFADQIDIIKREKKVKRCPHCGGEI